MKLLGITHVVIYYVNALRDTRTEWQMKHFIQGFASNSSPGTNLPFYSIQVSPVYIFLGMSPGLGFDLKTPEYDSEIVVGPTRN